MNDAMIAASVAQLKFRNPVTARALITTLHAIVAGLGRTMSVMHVCGSHEQAIAKFGLRSVLPRDLNVIMGPGCPVCITDMPEVDEAVVLVQQGAHVCTYGDMLRVPGTTKSLAQAQADGGTVHVVYSVSQCLDIARAHPGEPVVFFATGFETTAVATAAVALDENLPPNFSILSAHKYVPPAMEIVARVPETHVEGFLAAGHAAVITGYGLFESFAAAHKVPVVVAGFEPLDILAGLVKLVELVRDGRAEVANMYPRCVTRDGNRRAQEQMWKVFELCGGHWRGIAFVPNGNLVLRAEYAHIDARRRFTIDLAAFYDGVPRQLTEQCICGPIMTGLAAPTDCRLFGRECLPESPVGACMVSSEGTCKIWHQYGGYPELGDVGEQPVGH